MPSSAATSLALKVASAAASNDENSPVIVISLLRALDGCSGTAGVVGSSVSGVVGSSVSGVEGSSVSGVEGSSVSGVVGSSVSGTTGGAAGGGGSVGSSTTGRLSVFGPAGVSSGGGSKPLVRSGPLFVDSSVAGAAGGPPGDDGVDGADGVDGVVDPPPLELESSLEGSSVSGATGGASG